VLAANLRYFVNNRAIGIFEQGDSGCRVGYFVRMRAWYLAHLLWNPNADEQQLYQTFMNGYYGAAAGHLMQAIAAIDEAGRKADTHLGCYITDTRKWLSLADLSQATECFAKAAAAVADDPVLSQRVRRERMPLDYVWLQRYDSLRREARAGNLEFRGPADPEAALAEFRAMLEKYNAGEYRQGRRVTADYGNDLPFLLRKRTPAGDTPAECQGLAKDAWIDLQEADYVPRSERNLYSIEKDAAASNGLARRMPNVHRIWACHSNPLGDYGVSDGIPWHVYMRVRCDAASEAGTAMTVGIYDDAQRRSVATKQVAVKTIRGQQYQTIDLGVHALGQQMYVWAAPVVRDKNEVEAVYVDRVFLVRAAQR
jgi:hypothetical protein